MVNSRPTSHRDQLLTELLLGTGYVPETGQVVPVCEPIYRERLRDPGSNQAAHPATLFLSGVISTEDQPSVEIQ